MLHHATVLEAHKSGMNIDQQTIIQHEQALCDLETFVYGPQISDIYGEVHAILDHLHELIQRSSNQLSIHTILQKHQSDYNRFVLKTQERSNTYQHQNTHNHCHTNTFSTQVQIPIDQVARIFAQVVMIL